MERFAISIKKIRFVEVLVAIAFVAVIFGCNLSSPCNQIEANRIKSPDGTVEAVLVKNDCGATTSESLSVFVVGSGKETEESDLVFKADHTDSLSLLWRETNFLEIKYKQARIFQFTNFWQSKDVDNFRYVVEVREISLSRSHALSASDRWEK